MDRDANEGVQILHDALWNLIDQRGDASAIDMIRFLLIAEARADHSG